MSKYSTRKRLHRPVVLEYNLAVKNVKIVSKLATLRQSFRFCQHSPNIFKYNDERLQMFPGTIFSFSPREGRGHGQGGEFLYTNIHRCLDT